MRVFVCSPRDHFCPQPHFRATGRASTCPRGAYVPGEPLFSVFVFGRLHTIVCVFVCTLRAAPFPLSAFCFALSALFAFHFPLCSARFRPAGSLRRRGRRPRLRAAASCGPPVGDCSSQQAAPIVRLLGAALLFSSPALWHLMNTD